MKKRLRFISIISGIALLASACSAIPANHEITDNISKIKNENRYKLEMLNPTLYSDVNELILEPGTCISIIGRHSNDSYWNEVELGAKQAISDINEVLGYKREDKIKLIYSAPDVLNDVDEQINLLDEELARAPLAIAIAPIDSTAFEVQFQLAADSAIPVLTFDSGSKYTKNTFMHISTDNQDAAKTAAQKLATMMDESGEVAVFVQDSYSTTAADREKGFIDTIKKDYPDISVVNVYHMDQLSSAALEIANAKNAESPETPIDPAELSQEDVIRHIIETYPDLKAVYTTNLDTTQQVADALKGMGRDDLYFVGFDGGEEQMALLEDYFIDGLIVQNPYGMGYAAVIAAARHALNLPNESFVNTGYTWVTRKNMNDEEIKHVLY